MEWEPASEVAIWEKINGAERRMSPAIFRFWETVRIVPTKWKQTPWGDAGKGFWVVGVLGQIAIWYNDIEEGFNYSAHVDFKEIRDYWCNQDELEHTLIALHHLMSTGEQVGGKASPPMPLPDAIP